MVAYDDGTPYDFILSQELQQPKVPGIRSSPFSKAPAGQPHLSELSGWQALSGVPVEYDQQQQQQRQQHQQRLPLPALAASSAALPGIPVPGSQLHPRKHPVHQPHAAPHTLHAVRSSSMLPISGLGAGMSAKPLIANTHTAPQTAAAAAAVEQSLPATTRQQRPRRAAAAGVAAAVLANLSSKHTEHWVSCAATEAAPVTPPRRSHSDLAVHLQLAVEPKPVSGLPSVPGPLPTLQRSFSERGTAAAPGVVSWPAAGKGARLSRIRVRLPGVKMPPPMAAAAVATKQQGAAAAEHEAHSRPSLEQQSTLPQWQQQQPQQPLEDMRSFAPQHHQEQWQQQQQQMLQRQQDCQEREELLLHAKQQQDTERKQQAQAEGQRRLQEEQQRRQEQQEQARLIKLQRQQEAEQLRLQRLRQALAALPREQLRAQLHAGALPAVVTAEDVAARAKPAVRAYQLVAPLPPLLSQQPVEATAGAPMPHATDKQQEEQKLPTDPEAPASFAAAAAPWQDSEVSNKPLLGELLRLQVAVAQAVRCGATDRLQLLLGLLARQPVTPELLLESQAGRCVSQLQQHGCVSVARAARLLLRHWRLLLHAALGERGQELCAALPEAQPASTQEAEGGPPAACAAAVAAPSAAAAAPGAAEGPAATSAGAKGGRVDCAVAGIADCLPPAGTAAERPEQSAAKPSKKGPSISLKRAASANTKKATAGKRCRASMQPPGPNALPTTRPEAAGPHQPAPRVQAPAQAAPAPAGQAAAATTPAATATADARAPAAVAVATAAAAAAAEDRPLTRSRRASSASSSSDGTARGFSIKERRAAMAAKATATAWQRAADRPRQGKHAGSLVETANMYAVRVGSADLAAGGEAGALDATAAAEKARDVHAGVKRKAAAEPAAATAADLQAQATASTDAAEEPQHATRHTSSNGVRPYQRAGALSRHPVAYSSGLPAAAGIGSVGVTTQQQEAAHGVMQGEWEWGATVGAAVGHLNGVWQPGKYHAPAEVMGAAGVGSWLFAGRKASSMSQQPSGDRSACQERDMQYARMAGRFSGGMSAVPGEGRLQRTKRQRIEGCGALVEEEDALLTSGSVDANGTLPTGGYDCDLNTLLEQNMPAGEACDVEACVALDAHSRVTHACA